MQFWHNEIVEFFIFNKSQFFLTTIAQFDKNINLFCLVSNKIYFASNILILICSIFFTTDAIRFHYYLQSGNISLTVVLLLLIIRQYFLLTINFIAFDFVILSDLNSNLVESLFLKIFLVDCLLCLNISLTALKISKSSLSRSILISLQPNLKLESFYFIVNISATVSVFINFY